MDTQTEMHTMPIVSTHLATAMTSMETATGNKAKTLGFSLCRSHGQSPMSTPSFLQSSPVSCAHCWLVYPVTSTISYNLLHSLMTTLYLVVSIHRLPFKLHTSADYLHHTPLVPHHNLIASLCFSGLWLSSLSHVGLHPCSFLLFIG